MPEVQLLRIMLEGRMAHARASERGVSAVEWVLITAALVILVGFIATILTNLIKGKAENIKLD